MEAPGNQHDDLDDQSDHWEHAAGGEGGADDAVEDVEGEWSEGVHGQWLVASVLVLEGHDGSTQWAAAEVEDEDDEWEVTLHLNNLEELALEFVASFVLDEWLEVVVFRVEHILFNAKIKCLYINAHIAEFKLGLNPSFNDYMRHIAI